MSTQLRNNFIADMTIEGLSQKTIDSYVSSVITFSRFYQLSPSQMGRDHMREYLLHAVKERGCKPATIKMYIAALKKLYKTTLGRPEEVKGIVYPTVKSRRPIALTISELTSLFEHAPSSKHLAVFVSMFALGVRVGVAVKLRIDQIDSKSGLVHILQAKGNKDREVMLSQRYLGFLRRYWAKDRPAKPWLFPGQKPGSHISVRAVQHAFTSTMKKAGIRRAAGTHSLRHSFATVLLEAGVDLAVIRVLMGHSRIKETARYAHVRTDLIRNTSSPFDQMADSIDRLL